MLSTVSLNHVSTLFILMSFFLKRELYIRNDHLKWALGGAVIVPSAWRKAGTRMARGFGARPAGFDGWYC